MKAVLVVEPFKIEIIDIPIPEIKAANDVLIKVLAGGICGSDIAIYNGTNSLATYPRVIGHEFCGEVIEIGSGVSKISQGDIVAVDPVISCGSCYACTHGHHNVCETLIVSGVHSDGGFSEYYLAKENNCHIFNASNLDKEFAALVEPYSIGCEINNRARVSEEDFVVIMGSGPIGITAMQVAKSRNAKVLMTDLLDSRLDRAKKMGADWIVNVTNENLEEKVFEYCGRRPNVIVDSVCTVKSPVEAMQLAAPAGRVIILGTRNDESAVPQVLITMKELDVLGSRLSNNCFPEVIELFKNQEVNPAEMITHSYNYNNTKEAINLILEKPEDVCKVRLTFEESK